MWFSKKIFVPNLIVQENVIKDYFQSMVEEICNRFTHHFARKNCYFIVAKVIKIAIRVIILAIFQCLITNQESTLALKKI